MHRHICDIGTQTVRVQLMGAPEHQTLVVLANVREQVNTLAAAFGEQKEGVMNRLAFDVGTDAAPDFTNGIPMWGELQPSVAKVSLQALPRGG